MKKITFNLGIVFLLGVPFAFANPELDRQFTLETIGALKTLDNVDGVFSEYVNTALEEYFSNQTRFHYQDISKASLVLTKSKIPYSKIVEDTEILKQISKSLRLESIIRTKILKEGSSYRFTLEWLHTPQMELMAAETFQLEEPSSGQPLASGDLRGAYQKALENMIRKVPFVGHVSGRDQNNVTINLGSNSPLNKGDILIISSLSEVKKHPLLKSITEWKFSPIGKLRIEQIESGLAFCEIIEEEPGKQISKYQKITEVIPLPIATRKDTPEQEMPQQKPPSLGWGNGGLWIGSFSRQYSTQNGASGFSGSSFLYGAKIEGQLWLTRDWFSELSFGYGLSSYSQKNLATGTATLAGAVSQTAFHFRGDVGYNYYLHGDLYGPRVWARAGYKGTSYSLPASLTEFTSPVSFKSPFVGVGGEIPIRDKYIVKMGFDLGVFVSAKETTATLGTITSATDISFYIGGSYRMEPKMTLNLGLEVLSHGADYSDQSSLTQKIVSVGPSLIYYF